MKRNLIAASVIALLFASCAFVNYVPLSDMPLITKEQMVKLIDDPKVTILDVRVGQDWTDSRRKIKGAVREEPRQFLAWAQKYPKDRQLVLYCE